MNAFFKAVVSYAGVIAALFPTLGPVLEQVVGAVSTETYTVPTVYVTIRGQKVQIGPIPVSLVK